MEVGMLQCLPPGSRAPIYLPSTESVADDAFNTFETFPCDASSHPPPPRPPHPAENNFEMPRVTIKKGKPEMLGERRRPSVYRPRSRTDSGSTSRIDGGRHRGDGGGSSDEESARHHTLDLRQRLQEEASIYKRRLDTYRQAQQDQAALVSRLQAKVLQYKQRCAELESQMLESGRHDIQPLPLKSSLHYTSPLSTLPSTSTPSSALEQAQQHLRELREEKITDLDTALHRLEEERRKNDKLMKLNATLREQLEESHSTNEALTADLQKLTNDWETLREEMIIKEDEWKDEEQAFNEYYSTEHNRLLNLWRDVVSVKRLFVDIHSSTERDLNSLRSELNLISREMLNACTRMDTNIFTDSILGQKTDKYQRDQEAVELRNQLESIKMQHQNYELDIKMKEERIKDLSKNIQILEERCANAEQNLAQTVKMQEEIDILQGALRDIASAIIQDSENKELEAVKSTHIHLSTPTPVPQKSPKKARSQTTPAAFAESTISAVQAALHRYQSVIHELQVKLQSNKEQLLLVRKQYENCEDRSSNCEKRVQELVAQLDACRTQCLQLTQEKEFLLKSLDSLKAEKSILDRNRLEITSMVEALNADYEKLQKINNTLQKEIDSLHEEKIFLQTEIQRMAQEADLREINLRGEEDRCSRMREELLTVKEELHKLYLSHDLLEQQKVEADNIISNLEKIKSDYELELEKILSERSEVHEVVSKKETIIISLEADKKRLQDEIKRLEDEKLALYSQSNDHANDIQSLRKELLQAEQQKLDLESDKVTLNEKIKFLEIEKNKIEMELSQIIRERNDLNNQLTAISHKKDQTNEELMRTRQRLEQATETNSRINRTLEDLVKECEEKQCLIDSCEKDIQRLQEQFASIRSEKETLEAVLFDTQTNLEATDVKKMTLEQEQQELLVKQEQLKAQVARLTKDLERCEKRCVEVKNSLIQQFGNKEAEYKQTIEKLKIQNEENIQKLTDEREKIRNNLEKRLQQSLQQLGNEKDNEIHQLLERIENLQNHIDNLCEQHEELMLRAENDKQQALLIAHHDQQALQERLEQTKKELENERENLEKLKRESHGRFEQDRVNINSLKEELNKYKTKLEDCKARAEEERIRLEQQIEEIKIERDNAQSEVENLKVQLHLGEDKCESITNQLHETIRKLKEAENNSESLRKEITDIRRLLADSNFEKEKYHNTNKELRDHIKKCESEKRDLNRQLEETLQKVSNLEEIKASIENEKNRLQTQLRDLERDLVEAQHKIQSTQEELQRTQSSSTQQQAEEKELQARLLNEVEERERAHQEVHQIKKQMAELERNLEQTRKELNKTRAHGAQLEEQWHAREQDLLVHLEDSRGREKRLEDQRHNLEVCLVDATQQIQELKAKLGGSEGRVRALEAQMSQLEASKREVEQKLLSIISILRRIAGVQLDGTVSMPYRLLSPSRRWSPARGHDHERDGTVDIDPEVVRKGVRSLMQQVAQIERERDDFKTQVSSMKKQLQEAHDSQAKGDSKLNKLLQTMRALQEEKGSLEAKLGQKAVELQSQTMILLKKNEENQQIRDKLVHMELTANTLSEEKRQLEDKIEKMKMALNKLEAEKRALQEELARVENRATKLELQRMSAEGDLQRLQLMLQEKDSTIEKLQEKCDSQSRSLASLEERCLSLKQTIDQQAISLDKASVNENELRAEIQSLQRALMESTTASHSGVERIKQLQKQLANCENERRIITERLETTQQNLAEMRRNNQILQDQVTRLNTELANNEVAKSGLESQLRLAQWPTETGLSSMQEEELQRQLYQIQKERNELRGKIDLLNNKIRQLEAEKRNYERSHLKTSTLSLKGRLYDKDRQEKYESDTNITEIDRFEQENRELKLKISRLESELNEKDAEIARLRSHQRSGLDSKFDRAEIERYRAAQLQAERLLEAREQSHRQQITRLENQLSLLREQLNQEIKRRQQYVLRSTKAGREMQQLRQALGDSLRTVSQDPSLDALLLEHEARKLDSNITNTASLPPALALPPSSSFKRSTTPQPK